MLEVESSGTLAGGKKALDELQKRKLITTKYVQYNNTSIYAHFSTQEGSMVHGRKGPGIQRFCC